MREITQNTVSFKSFRNTALVLAALSAAVFGAESKADVPVPSTATYTSTIKSPNNPHGVRTQRYEVSCPYDVGSVGTFPAVSLIDNTQSAQAELSFILFRGAQAVIGESTGRARGNDAGVGTYNLTIQSSAMASSSSYIPKVDSSYTIRATCYNRVTNAAVAGIVLSRDPS